MNRSVTFNSPFLLGFEHLERLLERTAKSAGDGYPPYNIEQSSDDALRITLAVLSNRPILVVGDLEQVRDVARRAIAVERLGAIATQRTVIVGVTNPLGAQAPEHDLHDHRMLTGKD